MNLFCDTSVLIAALLEAHPNHTDSLSVLESIRNGENTGCVSAHSLAETFSVLTRMPTKPKLLPSSAWAMIQKYSSAFHINSARFN